MNYTGNKMGRLVKDKCESEILEDCQQELNDILNDLLNDKIAPCISEILIDAVLDKIDALYPDEKEQRLIDRKKRKERVDRFINMVMNNMDTTEILKEILAKK